MKKLEMFYPIEVATVEEREEYSLNETSWLDNKEFLCVFLKKIHVPHDQILRIINESWPILKSHNVGFWLFQVYKISDVSLLTRLVKQKKITYDFISVDEVHILRLLSEGVAGENYNLDDLRVLLKDQFPDKIKPKGFIQVGNPGDALFFKFETYREDEVKLMRTVFIAYNEWFNDIANILTPQFEDIREEINDLN